MDRTTYEKRKITVSSPVSRLIRNSSAKRRERKRGARKEEGQPSSPTKGGKSCFDRRSKARKSGLRKLPTSAFPGKKGTTTDHFPGGNEKKKRHREIKETEKQPFAKPALAKGKDPPSRAVDSPGRF